MVKWLSRGGYFSSLDPRARVAFAAASLIVVFRAERVSTLVVTGAVVLALVLAERLSWAMFLRPVRYLVWLLPVTFLVHVLFAPEIGALSLSDGWRGLTDQVFLYAGFYTGRIAVMLLISALLISTISSPEIVESLRRLGRPLRVFRVPVEDIAQLIYLSISFVPILGDELQSIREAQIARGLRPGKSLRSRARGSLPIVIPLFFSALGRAGRLAVAMESRGYSSGARRTSYVQMRFGLVDAAFVSVMVHWVATTF